MSWRLRSSITRRLAVLFAAVVMLTLAAVGSYLYRSLASQLEFRDDSELLGKVTQTRHLLEEVRSVEDIDKARDSFLNVVFAHEGLIFVLARADGEVLIQNVQAPAFPTTMNAVPAGREPTVLDISDWRTGNAAPLRAIAARGVIGGAGGEELQIMLAREGTERAALLADYRRDLIFAGIIGGLVASLLGWLTVRRGLAPVGLVAKKVNEISSRRLDTRLDIDEAPDELRELTGAFNAMLDRLEDGVRRLSGFSADLAHDLRTPLNALMLKSQVGLSRPRGADEYRALIESNIEEYERLSGLIERTLFLARADNAQLALHLETVNVRSTLDKVAEYFSGIAEEAGVRLAVSGQARVTADPTLMERAVSNLVSNGIRHAAAGATLQITASERDGAVRIAVENPGAGIPAEHLDRLFDRYFRGDASRSESTGSAGLGLSIVRAIMNLHEGTAQVTSDGSTTRFTLEFPSRTAA